MTQKTLHTALTCTEQESESTASPEARHYLELHVELYLHDIANDLTQN